MWPQIVIKTMSASFMLLKIIIAFLFNSCRRGAGLLTIRWGKLFCLQQQPNGLPARQLWPIHKMHGFHATRLSQLLQPEPSLHVSVPTATIHLACSKAEASSETTAFLYCTDNHGN